MQDNKSAYNAAKYDGHIANVLPYYNEYHAQVIDLVKATGIRSPKWLDSGCGTGTLALRALESDPDIRFTLCDPSENMLGEAKAKLAGYDIRFMNVSSDALPFKDEFDVVTAIQSHHYYGFEERETAVRHCFDALRSSGIFVTFENVRMSEDISDELALKRWVSFLRQHGNSEEDVQMQLGRRGTEVLPITVGQHLEMLKRCGFRSVDVLWASYLQAGFWAVK